VTWLWTDQAFWHLKSEDTELASIQARSIETLCLARQHAYAQGSIHKIQVRPCFQSLALALYREPRHYSNHQHFETNRPFKPINIPDRTWPDRQINAAPRWLSSDLRDGNQALVNPMNVEQKTKFFELVR
jgi:hypothetical protein